VATKSLIVRTEFDYAKKSHNCRADKDHRIQQGEKRLNVRVGRSWSRYCMTCAAKILGKARARLAELAAEGGVPD
jgi:hypothetical protein